MPRWPAIRVMGPWGPVAITLALAMGACQPLSPASSPDPGSSPSPETPTPQASASPSGGTVEPVITF